MLVHTSDSWYAVTVHPKHEQLAERALRAHGFDTYVPVHRARRQWSDRVKTLDTVLFPGYVFARFDRRLDKLRVMTSASVRGIVCVGRDPVAVDDSELSAVRALIASGKPIDVCPYLRVGQHVRITEGPFTSVRGKILRAGDNWRVVVSIEALGCSVSVEVDADQVTPEKKPPQSMPLEKITHGHIQA